MRTVASRLCAFLLIAIACVTAHAATLAPGDYEFALVRDGLRRSYLVHVPPQAAAAKALPLVVNFHGGGSNAEVQKAYTRMDAAADRDGYIAVYPNGSSGLGNRFLTWNAGTCCGPAAALGVDDVGFTHAVLDDLMRRTAVDGTRIYVTGLSNGAMMAYRFAAEAAERVAAVAGVAGTMATQRFSPSRAMPVMHIHSTGDHIARYHGGFGPSWAAGDTRIHHLAVEELIRRWTGANACPRKPARVEPFSGMPGTPDEPHTAIRRAYTSCREGVEVVLWQLGGGVGHVWPGGVRDFNTQLLGAGTAVIDANEEMWKFFSRFRR